MQIGFGTGFPGWIAQCGGRPTPSPVGGPALLEAVPRRGPVIDAATPLHGPHGGKEPSFFSTFLGIIAST